MNHLRGYVMVACGVVNLVLGVRAAQLGVSPVSAFFFCLWCFGFGFYWLAKGK